VTDWFIVLYDPLAAVSGGLVRALLAQHSIFGKLGAKLLNEKALALAVGGGDGRVLARMN